MTLRTALAACLLAGTAISAPALAEDSGLYVCAQHEPDSEDTRFEWRKGSVLVPARSVFD